MVKPVKRENSNTTNTTHITGITASTNGTTAGKNNAAFYSTQYKGIGNKPAGFFPNTTLDARNIGIIPGQIPPSTADGNSNNYEEASTGAGGQDGRQQLRNK